MSRIPPVGAARRPAPVAALLGALLTLLVAPSLARAASLTLSAGADPVAGLTSGVDYQFDTGGVPLSLTVIDRSADGPACQPTSVQDASLAGTDNFTYIVPGLPLTGTGGDHIPYTFTTAGSHRVCAWLSRTPDDVVATTAATVEVRAPHVTLAITASEQRPTPGGSDVRVEATGTTEAPADVLVTAVPATHRCPATYDDVAAPRPFDVTPAGVATRVTGGFDLTFTSRGRMRYGSWIACAYVQDGTEVDTAGATATAPVELVLKPWVSHRPRLRRRRHAIVCDGGRWRGYPKPKLAFAWYAGRHRLPFHGRQLPITHATKGKRVRCRVTATNAEGSRTATSKAMRAR